MSNRGKPRVANCPEVGFWKIRLESRGPFFPARIFRPCMCSIHGSELHDWQDDCDRYPQLQAEINGFPVDPLDVWHHGGREITEAEYWRMIDPFE